MKYVKSQNPDKSDRHIYRMIEDNITEKLHDLTLDSFLEMPFISDALLILKKCLLGFIIIVLILVTLYVLIRCRNIISGMKNKKIDS